MEKKEIVVCIYKHAGRTDDLDNLTELAEDIARMAAEEEREKLRQLSETLRGDLEKSRFGIHGHGCVDDDYFCGLSYAADRIDDILQG